MSLCMRHGHIGLLVFEQALRLADQWADEYQQHGDQRQPGQAAVGAYPPSDFAMRAAGAGVTGRPWQVSEYPT
tara:strand:- start:20465 stop:20683 length:219 start_codon:yes stop_codon:yes gene_type:complete